MHKSLVGLAAAAALGFAAVAAPASAKADCVGCAVGAGILGGVAAGAIIGSAIANSPPPPPPRPTTIRHRLPRPSIIPRQARAMPRWRPDATGVSAKFGLRATATAGGPYKSASNESAA